MAQSAAEFTNAAASTQIGSNVFKTCRETFLEWRERQKVRTALRSLSERELADFGISSGEIEYTALNRNIDPRGSR